MINIIQTGFFIQKRIQFKRKQITLKMVVVFINGKRYEVEDNITVLKACKKHGIYIPTLCYHNDLPASGKCGLCVVKVDGSAFAYSCMTKVKEGMSIETSSPDVLAKAKESLGVFMDMSYPPPSSDIERVYEYLYPKDTMRTREFEKTTAVQFDPKKCIDCGRCVRMCEDIQHVGALNDPNPRMRNNECISCGQCIMVCPTKALTESSSIPSVLRALATGQILILQTAPSVRVSAGEPFGDPVGTIVTGKIVTAARMLGFKYVFDTNYSADMTILEEGTELIHRVTKKGVLPMFTSCCPAWINFVEKHHPELIPHLSTCKSPHMMFGRVIKMILTQKLRVDQSKLFVVSMMPCTAKKDEIKRMQMQGDVDCVITVREFCKMVKQFGIEWSILRDGAFDDPLGEATGGAAIFGVTGGVTEAAVRFAHEAITGSPLGKVVYDQFRGNKSVKSATLKIGTVELKVAVCSGIGAARDFIESGEYKSFTFIEVMSCPGGCIVGGGQPKLANREDGLKRAKSIYQIDDNSKEKVSNHNQQLLDFYKLHIGEVGSHKAHLLLHTHYEPHETAILAMRKRMQSMPAVAYGSASGNAMKFARLVAGFMGSASQAMNNFSVSKILKRGTAVFVVSTIGDGEFPNNCQAFISELEKSTENMKSLRYAVCGIGSKAYTQFCGAGKKLQALLEKHSATQLLPFCSIDVSSSDAGESAFEKWSLSLCSALGLKAPKIGVRMLYKVKIEDDPSIIDNPIRPNGFEIGRMLGNSRMTPEDFDPRMSRYTIKLPSGLSYETGDHLAILPRNDQSIASSVITALKLDPKSVLRITPAPMVDTFVPNKVSVNELFCQYLDLNGLPDRSLMRAFIQSSNKQGIQRLENLMNPLNEKMLNDMLSNINIAEFIIEFSKYGIPPIELLISSCPHIKPRLYSIASSPLANRSHLDLVVANVQFGPDSKRYGLCTHFLNSFGLTKIPIQIRQGVFKYPEDKGTPIVMACLGAGIAPMLALLQHREYLDGQLGPAILFFGARNKRAYPTLEELFKIYGERGLLNDTYIAYSRDGNTKTYITDHMRTYTDVVFKYWKDPRAQFFYCGPSRGIPDELRTIMNGIVQKEGKVSPDEAKAINDKHMFWMEAY